MSREKSWHELSRAEKAREIQEEARTHGHDMPINEARMAADHYDRQLLAEQEARNHRHDAEAAERMRGAGGGRMTGGPRDLIERMPLPRRPEGREQRRGRSR